MLLESFAFPFSGYNRKLSEILNQRISKTQGGGAGQSLIFWCARVAAWTLLTYFTPDRRLLRSALAMLGEK